MHALLQLQWSVYKSTIFIYCVLIVLTFGFIYTNSSEIALLTLALAFSGSSARDSLALLKQNNGQRLIYAMPIPRPVIIKALYSINFFICTAVFLFVAPFQLFSGLLHDSLFTYAFAWLGFYCGCLMGTVFFLTICLDAFETNNSIVAFFTLFAGMGFTFIPHFILSFATDGPMKWLFVFITPFAALTIYYCVMQNGIKKFTNRPVF